MRKILLNKRTQLNANLEIIYERGIRLKAYNFNDFSLGVRKWKQRPVGVSGWNSG